MKKFLLLLLFSCFINMLAGGQTTDTDEYNDEDSASAESYDTVAAADPFITPVKRILPDDSAKALYSDKAFGYMQYIDSLLRNKKVQQRQAEAPRKSTPGLLDNEGLRTLYWLLAMAAVAFIVFRIFAGNSSLFSRNKRLSATKQQEYNAEDETHLKPEDLLTKAIREKNYRLATRFLYLQTLTLLGERNTLLIAPQKTNYQYVQEIKDKNLQQQFAILTLHYEYAWFGNFALNDQQFATIENEFSNFKSTIGQA